MNALLFRRYDRGAGLPSDPTFERAADRRRNVVERLVDWLKERRRQSTAMIVDPVKHAFKKCRRDVLSRCFPTSPPPFPGTTFIVAPRVSSKFSGTGNGVQIAEAFGSGSPWTWRSIVGR
jgi:hypothetical protein